MCGEYKDGEIGELNSMGSPPRVRGVQCFGAVLMDQIGITPACAGSTGIGVGQLIVYCGSPPRVRGVQFLAE